MPGVPLPGPWLARSTAKPVHRSTRGRRRGGRSIGCRWTLFRVERILDGHRARRRRRCACVVAGSGHEDGHPPRRRAHPPVSAEGGAATRGRTDRRTTSRSEFEQTAPDDRRDGTELRRTSKLAVAHVDTPAPAAGAGGRRQQEGKGRRHERRRGSARPCPSVNKRLHAEDTGRNTTTGTADPAGVVGTAPAPHTGSGTERPTASQAFLPCLVDGRATLWYQDAKGTASAKGPVRPARGDRTGSDEP